MTRDYTVYELQQAQAHIDNLQHYEQTAEEAKQRRDKTTQKAAEAGANKERGALLRATQSPSAIYYFLAATQSADETAWRAEWQENNQNVECLREDLRSYYQESFEALKPNMDIFPAYSFVLQFTFILAQPYISRDEQDFYIIDNPVRKDKVLGLPYVASTSWKGSLRAALWQKGYTEENPSICHLFGNKKQEEERRNLRMGRLFFFPTFFRRKSLEIINPQDRERRIGKNPIAFESVPASTRTGTSGIFTLLYVPFDLVGEAEETLHAQVAKELAVVAEGVHAMFRTSGFGAKTRSGFGLASETISAGTLQLRANTSMTQKQEKVAPPQPAPPSLPRYLEAPGRLRPEYRTSEGTFRERSDAELKKMSKGDKQLYDKAKSWWEREGKQLAEQPGAVASTELIPETQARSITTVERSFDSFEKLLERAQEVVELLKGSSAEVKHG